MKHAINFSLVEHCPTGYFMWFYRLSYCNRVRVSEFLLTSQLLMLTGSIHICYSMKSALLFLWILVLVEHQFARVLVDHEILCIWIKSPLPKFKGFVLLIIKENFNVIDLEIPVFREIFNNLSYKLRDRTLVQTFASDMPFYGGLDG